MYLYLVFSQTGTLISKLIMLFLRSKYVHVSISLDKSLKTMYSFGRVNPSNPFFGGFVVENFNKGIFSKNSKCECMVYRIPVNEKQKSILVNEISKFIFFRKHYKYNFLGLFANALGVSFKRKNRYFCSQFVTELLIKINVLNSLNKPELIRPADLMYITPKELIFEGYTSQYGFEDDNILPYSERANECLFDYEFNF